MIHSVECTRQSTSCASLCMALVQEQECTRRLSSANRFAHVEQITQIQFFKKLIAYDTAYVDVIREADSPNCSHTSVGVSHAWYSNKGDLLACNNMTGAFSCPYLLWQYKTAVMLLKCMLNKPLRPNC
ncbi:Hypothetical predicted protein [Podarcis lilfordi]|uniref:Uncharacterized protein n=1 Tax=Podarcis lilfordi TaxID=74358 RepID=A0AA35PDA2_9SAUR|nr:Hypothetical predicted protein [Podarcis lilfordi]